MLSQCDDRALVRSDVVVRFLFVGMNDRDAQRSAEHFAFAKLELTAQVLQPRIYLFARPHIQHDSKSHKFPMHMYAPSPVVPSML